MKLIKIKNNDKVQKLFIRNCSINRKKTIIESKIKNIDRKIAYADRMIFSPWFDQETGLAGFVGYNAVLGVGLSIASQDLNQGVLVGTLLASMLGCCGVTLLCGYLGGRSVSYQNFKKHILSNKKDRLAKRYDLLEEEQNRVQSEVFNIINDKLYEAN